MLSWYRAVGRKIRHSNLIWYLILLMCVGYVAHYHKSKFAAYRIETQEVPSKKIYNQTREANKADDVIVARRQEPRKLKEFPADFNTFELFQNHVAQNGKSPSLPEPKHEKLKVFVLPFTHVDPGWLKTFDKYTNDTNTILDNMVEFMSSHDKMRFMWMEMVFFERWWEKIDEKKREDVRRLVKKGNLEFASGSWTMTDEASAYLFSSVENIIQGQQYLEKHFGVKPSTVFSNDPFGYSNSVPFLFTKSGIKRNVINRIHHKLKEVLQDHRAIPFRWRQYFDEKGDNDILTQVLPYTHYDHLNSCGPDSHVCCQYDFKRTVRWGCNGAMNKPVTNETLASMSSQLVEQLKRMSKIYESPVMLMMHGDDFRFDEMEEWFQQHDNLVPIFDRINKGNEVEIRFGTFNDYFTSLEEHNKKNNVIPPTLSGDFFPYKCALGSYWTGYFTTRPFFKRQERFLMHLVRAADLLDATNSKSSEPLELARRNLSLFQHHDAITGTSKKHVMKDYSVNLFKSAEGARTVIEEASEAILGQKVHMNVFPEKRESMALPELLKIGPDPIHVVVYNPLPYSFDDVITIRTNSDKVEVEGGEYQVEPYVGMEVDKTWTVAIQIKLKPLSHETVVVKKATEAKNIVTLYSTKDEPGMEKVSEFVLKNQQLEVTFGTTGQMTKVNMGNKSMSIVTSLLEYKGSGGGAYIMRITQEPQMLVKKNVFSVSGPVRDVLHVFHDDVVQRFSLNKVTGKLGNQLNMKLIVDITRQENVEAIFRLKHGFQNGLAFTDSDGIQLIRREGYPIAVEQNYYPMPSAVVVADFETRITIASDVPHGFRTEGNMIEIMLDRRLIQDDGKGLGYTDDAIPNDMLPVKINFAIVLEPTFSTEELHYTAHTEIGNVAVQKILFPPIVMTSSTAVTSTNKQIPEFPCDVQLLDIRRINKNKRMLIIFRHGRAISQLQTDCAGNLETAVRSLLNRLNAEQIARTDLSGTNIASFVPIEQFDDFHLEPFDFLNLVF